jgi:cytochrome b subunit of formate dehydrogenase
MTAGYLFIFSVDILYAVLAGFVFRWLAIVTVTLVIAQSVGIILYYLVVFFLRPYSSDFFAWLGAQMKGRQERRAQGRSSFGPTMVLAGVSFMLVVLLVAAILFPGHTLDRILPVDQLRPVRYHLYLLVILASQLVIMQVFHRWLSRMIAKPVLAASERGLAREARALRLLSRRRSPRRRLRRIDRAASLLAETRLYRVKAARPIGLYTLFLLGSDFLAVLALRDVRRMDPQLRLPGRSRRKKGVTGTRAAGPLSAGRP